MAGEQERPFMFYKVVQNPLDDGMDFPARFVSGVLGGETRARLWVPEARYGFPVRIGRVDGRVRIYQGFRDFAAFYELRVDDILFFTYERREEFYVTIFDHSTAEIDYPVREYGAVYDPISRPQFYHRVVEDTINGLIFPGRFLRRYGHRLEGEMTLVDPYDPEGWRVRCIIDTDGRVWLTGARFQGFLQRYSIRNDTLLLFKATSTSRLEVTMFRNGSGTVIEYPRRTPLQRARALRTEMEGPSFISIMTQGIIGDSVTIPANFARVHFHDRVVGQRASVTLWHAHMPGMQVTLTFGTRKTRLRGGWKRFAMMQRLVPGNVCVFAWNHHDRDFTVYIFR